MAISSRTSLKSVHENITFLYEQDCDSFQEGMLGNGESFLIGKLRLNYKTPCQIKGVYLHLKGVEKTSWSVLIPPKRKVIRKGVHTFLNKFYKIWESNDPITQLDIPFKERLPNDIPETIMCCSKFQ